MTVSLQAGGRMSDRRGDLRVFIVLLVFGLGSLVSVLGRPSMQTIRPVDVVQLVGTGMCFGAAMVVLVSFLRSPKPN